MASDHTRLGATDYGSRYQHKLNPSSNGSKSKGTMLDPSKNYIGSDQQHKQT